jgi:signal transduction histidine kinase
VIPRRAERASPEVVDPGLTCERESTDLASYFRRQLPEDLLACIVIAVLLTLVVAPFMAGGEFRWLDALAFNGIVSLGIGLSVANSFRFLAPPLRRRFPGKVANVLIHVAIGVAATALGVEIAVRLIEGLSGMPASALRTNVLRVGLVIVAIAVAIDLAYERLRRRARRDEARAEQARKEALRAQLKALQARTNPHFLFNSLNTVAGLIEDDPEGAERVLEHLGGLFRYALRGSEEGRVRLAEEVAAVESYLEVESIRLGARLRHEIDIPAELREVLVPPLVLQPLVENSVLHGIAPRKDGGRVRVAAERHGSSLVLTVEDDGRGPGGSPHSGTGTSLAELEQRLHLLYGDLSKFEAGGGDGGAGFRVKLEVPVEIQT